MEGPTKILKMTLQAYDDTEQMLVLPEDRFTEAVDIIKQCDYDWDRELADEYEDFCEYYEEKLAEAGIDFEYINYDESICVL